MKKILEKRQLLMLTLVVALGAAVYLNYYFTKEPALSAGTDAVSTETGAAGDNSTDNSGYLGTATYVNAGAPDGQTDASAEGQVPVSAENYFYKARASRTAAREEAIGVIQDVLNNAQASESDKTAATQKATAIAENILRESNIESLIVAKGFPDCVVFIDGENCSVVVESENLQQQESVQILQIVTAQSDIVAQKVEIAATKA